MLMDKSISTSWGTNNNQDSMFNLVGFFETLVEIDRDNKLNNLSNEQDNRNQHNTN